MKGVGRPRRRRAGAAPPHPGGGVPELLIITGLSGSGKTHVSRALEDIGWLCVDNLPTALIPRFAELIEGEGEPSHAALVVDIRERDFPRAFPRVLRRLREGGADVRLLFLEADERALLQRFSETRRPHPLAINQPALDGIREEREALRQVRKMADVILDTTDFTVHQLRDHVRERYRFRDAPAGLVVSVMSFGFKHGVPSEADLVFDVRFLPNPNFVPRLKALTGKDPRVVRYLRRQGETEGFLRRLGSLLRYLVPRYEAEGKSYLTIAVGCTGGRHRSVAVAEALGATLGRWGWTVRVRHRDVNLS